MANELTPKNTDGIKVNIILEKTATSGVTVDGLLIKDNKPQAVADGTAADQFASILQLQKGAVLFGGTSTGTNAQVITLSPAVVLADLVAGMTVRWEAGSPNTGATTLNINAVGTKIILDVYGNALIGGEMVGIVEATYDGTDFILISANLGIATWTPTFGASGSMTYTSVTTNAARYSIDGKWIDFTLSAVGTTGGTASNGITATLPVTPVETSIEMFATRYTDGGNSITGQAFISSISGTGTVTVRKEDSVNFGLGPSINMILTGRYRY